MGDRAHRTVRDAQGARAQQAARRERAARGDEVRTYCFDVRGSDEAPGALLFTCNGGARLGDGKGWF